MRTAIALCLFTLDRVRTMLLAISFIILLKVTLVILAPDLLG
jgi:hypothetical protein